MLNFGHRNVQLHSQEVVAMLHHSGLIKYPKIFTRVWDIETNYIVNNPDVLDIAHEHGFYIKKAYETQLSTPVKFAYETFEISWESLLSSNFNLLDSYLEVNSRQGMVETSVSEVAYMLISMQGSLNINVALNNFETYYKHLKWTAFPETDNLRGVLFNRQREIGLFLLNSFVSMGFEHVPESIFNEKDLNSFAINMSLPQFKQFIIDNYNSQRDMYIPLFKLV